jgi:hypothetical protein
MRLLRGILALSVVLEPAVASAQNVLFYTTDVGEYTKMVSTASINGWSLTQWTPGDGTKSASQLSAYDALVVGWSGGTSDFSGILNSQAGITAARGSRTFLTGQDADYHQTYGNCASCAQRFITNAVDWAAAGSGLGIVGLSDYAGAWMTNSSSFLYSELINNVAYGRSGDNVVIPGSSAGYPVNAGLTSADLSKWGSSYHMQFRSVTPGYTTINTTPDFTDGFNAVTILTESEAAGGTTSAPEPASMVLMATGLVGIVGFARRKRNA